MTASHELPREPPFIRESRHGCSDGMRVALDYLDTLRTLAVALKEELKASDQRCRMVAYAADANEKDAIAAHARVTELTAQLARLTAERWPEEPTQAISEAFPGRDGGVMDQPVLTWSQDPDTGDREIKISVPKTFWIRNTDPQWTLIMLLMKVILRELK